MGRSLLRRVLSALVRPELEEERAAATRARERLPDAARLDNQILGTHTAGCAATYGVLERCNFACTSCYLPATANAVPPLPFDEVCEQLDRIREELGPWGNTQLTAGEVTLLPVDELGRIVRYCRSIELSAMVMTNGEVIRDDPSVLERLVRDDGLDKIALHVDVTQKGRRGLRPDARERDLHLLRGEFADTIRRVRRRTGRPLHAAHTFTVVDRNLDDVADVVRWTVEHSDAFRMLSLQPAAATGRTRDGRLVDREGLWRCVRDGLGIDANRSAWHMGHPDCSDVALMFVVRLGEETRLVEPFRKGSRIDARFLRRLLHGGFAGFAPDGEPTSVVAARLLGRLARHPRLWLTIPAFLLARAASEWRLLLRLLGRTMKLRPWSVRPFALVVHHFMSADELTTDVGRERVAACAFRVPVDGRMVSMCELNGSGERERKHRADRERLAPAGTAAS